LTDGEAGIVLRRFFSARAPAPTPPFRETEEVRGLDREVAVVVAVREVLGVAGTFLVGPIGLLAPCRAAVEGCRVVRREGVAATVLAVEVRSELVDVASDILLGLADMPSLLLSSPDGLSSTEPADGLLECAPAVGVDVEVVGLRTLLVVDVVGRAGGLLRELPPAGLAADEVEVDERRVPVEERRGAVGLVNGRVGGTGVFVLRVVVSSPREEACLSMIN
jgi:hypothetical protein